MIAWVRLCLLATGLALSGTAPAETLYEVISFGPPVAGAVRLHAVDNKRADLGDDLSLAEVDQATLDTLPVPAGTTRMVYQRIAPPTLTGRDAVAEAALLAPAAGAPQTYYLFAQLSPGAGQEAQFNAFYDSTHLPDVLNVPGMIWGLRARLVSQTPGTAAPAYLALYQFRSFNLRATIDEVDRRLKTQTTRPFPKGAVGPPSFAFYAAPATTR